MEQGEGQAWGSAVSGASGTGAIAGSGVGRRAGHSGEAGVQGARRPEPADVWVLLFSSSSNWEDGCACLPDRSPSENKASSMDSQR